MTSADSPLAPPTERFDFNPAPSTEQGGEAAAAPAGMCALAQFCPADSAEQCQEHEAHEPCPTPLSWRDVLETFLTEAAPFQLELGGRTLSGRRWGGGPPLYFLNGLAGSSELYCLLAYLLRDDFECVLLDDPRGAAARLNSHRTSPLDALADDLLHAAEELGDRTFGLFAASFGTAIALAALDRAPQRVVGAILLDAAPRVRWSFAERRLFGLARRLHRPLGRLPIVEGALERMHRPWFPPFDDTRWEFLKQNLTQTPLKELAARAIAWETSPAHAAHGEAGRALLLRTEGEGPVAAHRHEQLAAQRPSLQVEWMHSTGRLPFLTHPHRVARFVREFFQDDEAGA